MLMLMKVKVFLLASALFLASCADQEVQEKQTVEEKESLILNVDELEKLEGIVEYEVINIVETERISPPNPATLTTVFEVEDPESRFLDVTINLKNLTDSDKLSAELMDVSYTIGGQKFSASQKVEYDNASMLKDGEISSIESLNDQVVHYIAEVPKFGWTEEFQIDAVIGGKTYTSMLTLDEYNKNKEFITIGDTLEAPQYANLTFDNMYYTDKVTPSNPGSVSQYYEPESESNTFLVLEMKAENLKTSELRADSVFAAKATYDNYYEFDGFSTLVSPDGSNLEYSSISTIPSLNENTLLYILEVPKELKDTDGVVSIWFNNNYHNVVLNNQILNKQSTEGGKPVPAKENNEAETDPADSQSGTAQAGGQSGNNGPIKKGHNAMTTQETLDLISFNEGIDFSTHDYEMSFDEDGYLIIEVGLGEMAVGIYKIDSDGTLLQFDVVQNIYLPAEQVVDGGS